MKHLTYSFFLSLISSISLGQTIIQFEHKCLENYNDLNNLGGKLSVVNYSNDTTYLEFLTYAPCDALLEIIAKNLPGNNAIDLEVNNKSDSQTAEKCYCMYQLNPVIVGIETPQSKTWVIRNETALRSDWEKWFWDNL